MASDFKSPFRLWLDNDGSQSSFALPSPRLVENPHVPAPLLLGISDFCTSKQKDSSEEGEKEGRDRARVRLRLQVIRKRRRDGRKVTVSPLRDSISPLQMKRVAQPSPSFLTDLSRKYGSNSANRSLCISGKIQDHRALFTPTSPKGLKPKPTFPDTPTYHIPPLQDLPLHPYLTITNPRKWVEFQAHPPQYFYSPKAAKAEARPVGKFKETRGNSRIRRRSCTPVSHIGGKNV